jgi:hypothetical protein
MQKEITRGFLHFKEINRVTYESREIDPHTLIEALKKAGTYIGIAKPSDTS